MNGYLYQSVVGNLPLGLRRVEPGGPWTIDQGQLSPVIPKRRRRVRVHALLHGIADLQQEQAIEQFVDRRPLSPALRDLQALREEEQLTEAPITPPAYDRAEKVLKYLDAVAGTDLQPPHLAPDGSGGIRMEWFRGATNVRAVIPAREDQRPYTYFIVDGVSRVTRLSNAILFLTLRLYIIPR
jgi:hypothetical protein